MRLLALLVVLAGVAAASPPDARFKTDLLLFVAHPDDDTLPETYLAKLIVDEGKRVSVVYATPGDSGGNEQGPERGPSLGLVRQVEVRRGLAALGVTNIWILNGHDTAGQDPLRSLANWDHGRALADAVRLIRLTRPEVVLTWMPMQVAGENHGDHQASSVLATEAFDLAGDPTAFPEQLAAPTQMFENLLEGLAPWQPKKLYFMSDAITTEFMGGHGPSYPVTATSKEGKRYWEYSYEALKSHATQFRGQNEALAKADRDTRERMLIHAAPGDALIDPLRFVRGKSHVGGAVGGDVFEGVTADPIVFAAAPGFRPAPSAALTVGLGGPWRFYRSFWRAHGLDQMPAIDLHDFGPVSSGSPVHVPLLVTNGTDAAREVTVTAQLPDGWHEAARAGAVVVPARGEVEFTSTISGARPQTGDVVEVHYVVQGAADVVPLSVRVYFRPHGNVLPQ